MPSIFEESCLTSSRDLASFTPPPLPRPPAWICAFTTQTLPPSFCAASTASSTENAGKPRGVGTPYSRNTSLPWYSWIFKPPYPDTISGTTSSPSRWSSRGRDTGRDDHRDGEEVVQIGRAHV